MPSTTFPARRLILLSPIIVLSLMAFTSETRLQQLQDSTAGFDEPPPIAHPRCGANNRSATVAARVAVVFYGRSRNLSLTLPSIQRHIFDVLTSHSIAFDVVWSTMGGNGTDYNRHQGLHALEEDDPHSDFQLMSPCVGKVHDQTVVMEAEFAKYKAAWGKEDPWNDQQKSVRNLLCAFYSLEVAAQMVADRSVANGVPYDGIVVVRPDTGIMTDIDLPEKLLPIVADARKRRRPPEPTVWLPNVNYMDNKKSWYANDRFAFGTTDVMLSERYMRRGSKWRDNGGLQEVWLEKSKESRGFQRNGEAYLKTLLEAEARGKKADLEKHRWRPTSPRPKILTTATAIVRVRSGLGSVPVADLNGVAQAAVRRCIGGPVDKKQALFLSDKC